MRLPWGLALAAIAGGCVQNHSLGLGSSCSSSSECQSNHCVDGDCVGCASNTDCASDQVCAGSGRILGSYAGLHCLPADAGCASNPSLCPSGFTCYACPSGHACNDSTGECGPGPGGGPLPVCGMSDFSGGFDAGWGPGPNVNGTVCADCLGCPRGSECVCGVSGVIGGVRCTNLPSALACFATGMGGYCQVFPGDCATNTQCAGTATPLCSESATCVQCLKDQDCTQGAGAEGCVNNQCGRCCASNADCAPETPECLSGFCYPCTQDGGCGMDGGQDAGGPSDAGPAADAGDGG